MKSIKIVYSIGYFHMLSFADIYKNVISPFFTQPNLSYSIDNEFTSDESIRLIFNDFNTVIQCRKDGMTIAFQGSDKDFVSDSTNIREFYSILEAFQRHEMFTKITSHEVQVVFFDDKNIKAEEFLTFKPITDKGVSEFSSNYIFEKEEYICNLRFGNFVKDDIKKHNLFLFKNEITDELSSKVEGTLIDFRVKEITTSPSMNKLKNLLKFVVNESENIL